MLNGNLKLSPLGSILAGAVLSIIVGLLFLGLSWLHDVHIKTQLNESRFSAIEKQLSGHIDSHRGDRPGSSPGPIKYTPYKPH
jgi:hypothetical protein